jgi:hypothetical protein
MGSPLAPHGFSHPPQLSIPAPGAGPGVHRTYLRGRVILRHDCVRRDLFREGVLPAGAILLLGVLRTDECGLDRYSWVYVIVLFLSILCVTGLFANKGQIVCMVVLRLQ